MGAATIRPSICNKGIVALREFDAAVQQGARALLDRPAKAASGRGPTRFVGIYRRL